jgi:hypothetical protein
MVCLTVASAHPMLIANCKRIRCHPKPNRARLKAKLEKQKNNKIKKKAKLFPSEEINFLE